LIESNDNRKIKLGKVVVDKNKWRKSKLSDVASGFDYGMNAAAKEYDGKNKYIRITDIDDVSHKFNSIDLVSPNAELEDKYRVNEGDILFARTGASTGKSYLYDKNDGVLYFAGFLIRVHVLKDDPFFIYVQTLSLKYQNWLKKMSMRSGQPGVNAEEYKNLPILVPTLLEQNAITEVLSAAEKELSLLKQQLENYKKQKQGLMQKLLTGEWRVK
jgi:type I restriction enzyme S subunit